MHTVPFGLYLHIERMQSNRNSAENMYRECRLGIMPGELALQPHAGCAYI